MEKRAIIAVILSLVVLIGYQYLFVSNEPVVAEISGESATSPEQTKKEQENQQTAAVNMRNGPDTVTPQQAQGEAEQVPGKEILVETDTIKAVLSEKSASVKSWSLKKYMEKADGQVLVELVPSGRKQLELISTVNGVQIPDNLKYVADRESLNGEGSIKFTAIRPDGVVVTKTYEFQEGSYKAKIKVLFENKSSSLIIERPGLSLSLLSKAEKRGELYHELVYISGKDVKRVYPDKLKDEKFGSGNIDWVFLGDKYFMTAVMPANDGESEVYSKKINEELYEASLVSQPLQIKPGETGVKEYGIYFGPKEVDILKTAGSRLERTIDLGFFDLVAYPVLLALKWMYNWVPNYGMVVILLTVIIKILFWPLSQKSYKSMKEMQKLAPLMEQLREKYKDDKERLNREVMDLYKRYKVNPLGGCLPMLLQAPVFFALYTVLNGAVELRHAPFILWITDLSAKDPYYVTPVIMGVTMFIQQKMTPSATADPIQQKVMLLMPVIFTFMFLNFSSGLVLYWLVNNVLSIGQQHYVNKYTK